jgi:hypothetical protein
MALFKMVATEQLLVLCIALAIGSSHREARGTGIYLIFLAVLANTAMLLLMVRMLASRAEAASLPPDADAGARAAAAGKGIGSIATRWKRVLLRGMLVLAIGLSAASIVLAVVLFKEGSPLPAAIYLSMAAVPILIMALVHGFCAWVAVCHD